MKRTADVMKQTNVRNWLGGSAFLNVLPIGHSYPL